MASDIRQRITRPLIAFVAILALAVIYGHEAGALSANLGIESPRDENSQPSQTAGYPTQSMHHHRLRYTDLGQHQVVRLNVYLNQGTDLAGKSIIIRKENNQCFINPAGGQAPNGRIAVRITVGGDTYNIPEDRLCADSGPDRMFNRSFPLNGANVDADIAQQYVEVTIQYINPDGNLDLTASGNDRNAIGFSVHAENAPSAKVAPVGAGGRNFSVLSNQSGGSSQVKLPFADKCYAPGGQRIISIYDADAGNGIFGEMRVEVFRRGTEEKVQLTELENAPNVNPTTVRLTAQNKQTSRFSFNSQMYRQYVIVISNLYNGNTIDIGLPNQMEAIYGTQKCVPPPNCDQPGQPPCPQPEPRAVSITPVAAVDQSDMEPGESTTSTAYAAVEGFPSLYDGDWPFGYEAVQNADAQNIAPTRSAYTAQRVSPATSETPVITVLCQDGTAKTSCGAGYTCVDGHQRANCNTGHDGAGHGGYNWYCNWTNPQNGTVLEQRHFQRASAPTCAIWQYQCRSNTDSNQWVNSYKDWIDKELSGCDNRWVCPAPSGEPNIISGSQPEGNVCKLFKCAVPTDIGYNLEYDRVFWENGNANARCDFRCPVRPWDPEGPGNFNGYGEWAPLSSGDKHADGDLRCYYQPTFHIQCNINGTVFPAVLQPVQTDGNYCINHPVLNAAASAAIGSDVCMTVSVITPTNGQGWGGIGAGNGTTWSFSVGGPATSCAKVIARPIVHVRGGDVSVGSPFATSICAPNTSNSSIVTWPGVSHGGSSGEWAAYASGNITNFATAKKQNVNLPRGLTFANTVGSGNVYGGSFGPMPCIPNHAGMRAPGLPSINPIQLLWNAMGSGSYNFTPMFGGPNETLYPITIGQGRQLVVYVDGDLRITHDIRYDRSGWANLEAIPALKLVVSGDINIAPGVQMLEGVFVAQPRSDGSGGTINTCADASGNPVYNTTNFDVCRTTLTVNGSFIAERVNLARSAGTAIQGQPAEVFNYLPEVWFTDWPDADAQKGYRYDSVTNLPPTL